MKSNLWKPNIPKTMHCYWNGSFLSWLRYLTVLTFAKQNPDWLVYFYTPSVISTDTGKWEAHSKENEKVIGVNYLHQVDKCLPNVHRKIIDSDNINGVYQSDLLRLKWLHEIGGLYMDMDIISFKPMSEGIFNQPGIDTLISYSLKRKHYSIGFMMASANNDFYNFLYSKGIADEEHNKDLVAKYGDRQRYGVILWDSYFKNVEAIQNRFTRLNIFNIEFTTCYPYLYNDMDNILVNNALIEDDIIAIHYYGGHPLVRPWENLLTPENYKDYNTTLTTCIKTGLQE